jgi:hypothetical protein
LDRATKKRLDDWIASQMLAIVAGRASPDVGRWDCMTHDQAIMILLERDMMHKARKRRYAANKRGKGKGGEAAKATS